MRKVAPASGTRNVQMRVPDQSADNSTNKEPKMKKEKKKKKQGGSKKESQTSTLTKILEDALAALAKVKLAEDK